MRSWLAVATVIVLAHGGPAAAAGRPELAQRLAALNADLLSHASATGVLQARCPTPIRARQRRQGEDRAPPAEVRAELGVGPTETVRHRQVELLCGEAVFSHAENWYLPARLTPQMNAALETSQTPFGVVVGPLNFRRRTLSTRPVTAPPDVLQHRAVLTTPDGRPFSLVVETYTERALD